MKLRVEGLVKSFGKGPPANDGISLAVEDGEIFGLLGPNGAGKTTLVSQVMGLTVPSAGVIELDGVDIVSDPGYARRACSYQPQGQVPIDGLTALQAVQLVGQMRGGEAGATRRRAHDLMDALDISRWADHQGQKLSGGVKRLVGFCMAAVQPGSLVILDEPTNDVDPVRRRLLWEQVRELGSRGTAVLLVSHNVLEAERAVDRLAVINGGMVVASGSPAELKNGDAARMRLEVVLEPRTELTDNPGYDLLARQGTRRLFRVREDQASDALRWAESVKSLGQIEEYSIGPSTLEDAYIRLIGDPSGDTNGVTVNEQAGNASRGEERHGALAS